jgi:hypothetical protein
MEVDFSKKMDPAVAADYLGKSLPWLRQHGKRLGIKSYKIGGTYYYLKEDLDAWIEMNAVGVATDSSNKKVAKDNGYLL